jgi:hypothetical protein
MVVVNIAQQGPLGQTARALVAGLLAVTLVSATEAEARPKKRKPDLVVSTGRLSVPGQSEDAFVVGHGGTTTFAWKHTTRNRGKAKAGRSVTGVQFVLDAKHVVSPTDARARVPALGPGRSHATHGSFDVSWDDTWDYGTYPTRICADITRKVPESKEGNGCRTTHQVWVVPFGLTGTIKGEAVQPLVFPGVTLSWEFPAGVTFELQPHISQPLATEGILQYPFLDPRPDVLDLRYTISGTNTLNGCTWQGSGGYEPAAEFHAIELSFSRPRGSAHAQILVDRGLPQFSFSATVTCPGGSVSQVEVTPAEWGRAAFWLDLGAFTRFPDPGLTRLKGDYTDTNATYHWDLQPTDLP